MPVTILVGARPYPLDDEDARWLADHVRTAYLGGDTEEARVTLNVATAVEVSLESGEEEPLELGWLQVEGLAGCLRDYHVQPSARLSALYQALRVFRDDPPAKSLS